MTDDNYIRTSKRYEKQINELQQQIELLSNNGKGMKEKINYSVSLINNLTKIMREAPAKTKCRLIGSMVSEKIEFDGENYRTKNYNKVLDLIFQDTSKLHGEKKEKSESQQENSDLVPRPDILIEKQTIK